MAAFIVAIDAVDTTNEVVPTTVSAVSKSGCDGPPGLFSRPAGGPPGLFSRPQDGPPGLFSRSQDGPPGVFAKPEVDEVAKVTFAPPPGLICCPRLAAELGNVDLRAPPGLSSIYSPKEHGKFCHAVKGARKDSNGISPALSTDGGSSTGDGDSDSDSVTCSADDAETVLEDPSRTPLRLGASRYTPKATHKEMPAISCWQERALLTESTSVTMSIPAGHSDAKVMRMLDNAGFKGRYDIAHLSQQCSRPTSQVSACVNFLSHDDALRVFLKFQSTTEESVKAWNVQWTASTASES